MRRKIINIDTDENKKEVFEKFYSVNSKHQAHILFGISDNKEGSEYLKKVAQQVGFDFEIYKKRREKPKRYCLQCGNEIVSKNASKFCSNECHSEYEHDKAYKDFLENNDKYCRGNYVPKAFYEEFLKEQNYTCALCPSKNEHNGKPLRFVIDHIDGDASNNKRTNLRLVCPNCDSQLPTFKSKNKNSTRRKYWKEHIIKTLNKE